MYLAVLFQETVERGIRSGELQKETNAKALAQSLVVSLIGITVLLKARPDRSFIDNAVGVLLANL
ncbi:hypothetical protein D3C75_1357320 [compost metagenome]